MTAAAPPVDRARWLDRVIADYVVLRDAAGDPAAALRGDLERWLGGSGAGPAAIRVTRDDGATPAKVRVHRARAAGEDALLVAVVRTEVMPEIVDPTREVIAEPPVAYTIALDGRYRVEDLLAGTAATEPVDRLAVALRIEDFALYRLTRP